MTPSDEGVLASTPAEASKQELPRVNVRDLVLAVVALTLSVVFFFLMDTIQLRTPSEQTIDPLWWGRILGVCGVLLSIALVVASLVRRPSAGVEESESVNRAGVIRFGGTIALTIVYLLAWPATHFLPATLVFLVALNLVYGARGWKAIALAPVIVVTVLYALFAVALRIPL